MRGAGLVGAAVAHEQRGVQAARLPQSALLEHGLGARRAREHAAQQAVRGHDHRREEITHCRLRTLTLHDFTVFSFFFVTVARKEK